MEAYEIKKMADRLLSDPSPEKLERILKALTPLQLTFFSEYLVGQAITKNSSIPGAFNTTREILNKIADNLKELKEKQIKNVNSKVKYEIIASFIEERLEIAFTNYSLYNDYIFKIMFEMLENEIKSIFRVETCSFELSITETKSEEKFKITVFIDNKVVFKNTYTNEY